MSETSLLLPFLFIGPMVLNSAQQIPFHQVKEIGGKIFYTTGRLTSEMVIKVAQMGIPVLLSRSGATQMGYEIAQQLGVVLISRAKGKHFLVYNGAENIEFDAIPNMVFSSTASVEGFVASLMSLMDS